MPNFDLVRISLSKERSKINSSEKEVQLDLVYQKQPDPSLSRKDFLFGAFSKELAFVHHSNEFAYMPATKFHPSNHQLIGYFGRKKTSTLGQGPETNFAKKDAEDWHSILVACDISTDQQLVFCENRQDVGSPKAILRSFFEAYVKQFEGKPWHVDIENLTSRQDFWKFVEVNKGQITEVSFELIKPNGIKSGPPLLKDFDTALSEATNSNKNTYTLGNEEGSLDLENEFTKSAVDYVTDGGGQTKAKTTTKGNDFTSDEHKETVSVDQERIPDPEEHLNDFGIKEFFSYLFGKLSTKQNSSRSKIRE